MSSQNIVPMRSPVVQSDGGEVFADSRDVASFFEREHKSVLRAIRDMECSADFRGRNFTPFKINDLSGDSTSHVRMTRDGFMFLAMGFTGAKAAKWKEDYIAAFNAMEAELRKVGPALTNQFDMMRAVIDNLENNNQRLFSVEKKVENLGAHEDYRSIKAHAALIGRKLKGNESGDLGKLATSLSKQLGHKIGKQPDETYGAVNTYHRDVLEQIFKEASK